MRASIAKGEDTHGATDGPRDVETLARSVAASPSPDKDSLSRLSAMVKEGARELTDAILQSAMRGKP